MKRTKSKIFFFIFLAVFVTGIILLAIPFNWEKYSYTNSPAQMITGSDKYGFRFSVDIKNETGKELENVEVRINYSYREDMQVYPAIEVFKNVDIDESETFQITLEKNDFGLATFKQIDSVTITLDNGEGKSFKIYQGTLFSGPNWAYISMVIVGFFASVISFISWKHDPNKFATQETNSREDLKNSRSTFEERIKEAFAPEKQKSDKVVCPYCKCKYNSEKFDKCPNCGAPPEH